MFFSFFNSHKETVIVFFSMVIAATLIDFFINRNNTKIFFKRIAIWSLFWIAIPIIFFSFLYVHHGKTIAGIFFTSYLVEEVLSIDNLFVIMAILSWFKFSNFYSYRVLYWGIIGAIVFRSIFLAIGVGLLSLGVYINAFFALVIGWTAIVLFRKNEENEKILDYSNHLAYRLIKNFFPLWPKVGSHKFFLTQKEVNEELEKPENQDLNIVRREKAKLYATPLFLCLVLVELSDIAFAFDSIPVVLSISNEPMIIYSAMIFSMLGLRTHYFLLEVLKKYLIHLGKAVSALLLFIAFKLALKVTNHFWHHGYDIGETTTLSVVLGILIFGVILSIIFPAEKKL